MITIHITEKQYTVHHKLIIKLQKALAGMDNTTPQAAYNRRKRASHKQTSEESWSKVVEFTNADGKLCVQRVSGTKESLKRQFAKNKHLQPKWLSPLLERDDMAVMQWMIENGVNNSPDTTKSWLSI